MAETIIRVHCDHIFVHRFVAPEAKVGQPKRRCILMIKKALSICLLLALEIIAGAQQPAVIGCGAFPAGAPSLRISSGKTTGSFAQICQIYPFPRSRIAA